MLYHNSSQLLTLMQVHILYKKLAIAELLNCDESQVYHDLGLNHLK